MNDALLTGQLRALREPPPENGFEARLQLALAGEAQVLRAPGVVVPLRSARRLQRWGARIGLGTALALGASAAAAAGGIWTFAVRRAEPAAPAVVLPTVEQSPAGTTRSHAPVVAPLRTPAEPAEAQAEPDVMVLPEAAPTRTVTPPVERKAIRAEVPSRAERAPAAPRPREAREGLLLFELPKPAAAKPASPGSSAVRAAQRGSERARSTSERRVLPDLPARAEHQPGGPEHAERDKDKKEKDKKEPPGREIARERSLDKADRGLERAKEARERNDSKK